MADTTLLNLTPQTTVHDADPLYIVDTTDFTASNQGTGKSITRNSLLVSAPIVSATLTTPTAATIKGGASNTSGHSVPNLADDTFTLNAATQTLTGKTLTSPKVNQLMDTNGLLIVKYNPTASAVNYLAMTNQATGFSPLLAAAGTDLNIGLWIESKGTGQVVIADASAREIIKAIPSAAAVNEVSISSADTGNAPKIAATGDDNNIHLQVNGKGNGLTKTSVLRQDITTNTYKHNSVILTGWGYKVGDGSTAMTNPITFGITFAAQPVVILTQAGARVTSNGVPSTVGDLNAQGGYYITESNSVTTTGFTAGLTRTPTGAGTTHVFDSIAYWGYSWIAIGELT